MIRDFIYRRYLGKSIETEDRSAVAMDSGGWSRVFLLHGYKVSMGEDKVQEPDSGQGCTTS